MKMQRSVSGLLVYLLMVLLLSSCTEKGNQAATIDQVENKVASVELGALEDIVADGVIEKKYDGLRLNDIACDKKELEEYPYAARDCKRRIVEHLRAKEGYLAIAEKGEKLTGKTATVNFELVELRITSSTARFWGGALAGNSFMNILMTVTDDASGKRIYEKLLTSSNNAWGAAYSGGSTDKSLPDDFGVLIGEYIYKLIPAK